MVRPVDDLVDVVRVRWIRTAFDARGVEVIQTENLNRAFDTQMVQFVRHIQINDILLEQRHNPRSIRMCLPHQCQTVQDAPVDFRFGEVFFVLR